ncbi:hypothetical protein RSAG8_12802, partial [Rhizoctonia solani AG-8 WAC10335]
MHHVMRNDPRRRFVHGLTCENTKARLWYNDRCDTVASEEFDINQNWKHLVRIVLSMLLATRERLGYDPDTELLPSHDPYAEPAYRITIRNSKTRELTVYCTIKMISDVGADSMVGPGTRVWIVQKLVDGKLVGPYYVLKDVWVHEDRLPEHILLNKIRKQKGYSQYFLTPLNHGFAPSSATAPDNTHRTLRRMELIPTKAVLLTRSGTKGGPSRKALSTSRNSVGHPEDIQKPRQEGYRDFRYLSKHPRQHYRIVFKELGKPVHDLRNFTDIFTAIQGGLKGLHAIHLCGYVHRDVSSGNILLVPSSGPFPKRGVIMDLEYAKKIKDTSAPHDLRTGTAAFMATEVAFMRHHRLEELRRSPKRVDSIRAVNLRARLRVKRGKLPNPKPLPPFRHNPLHDMESIWWLCIWIMFYLVPAGERAEVQLDNYNQLFCNSHAKQRFFSNPLIFNQWTTHLAQTPRFATLMSLWSTTSAKFVPLPATSKGEPATRTPKRRKCGPSTTTIQRPKNELPIKVIALNRAFMRTTKRRKLSSTKTTRPQKVGKHCEGTSTPQIWSPCSVFVELPVRKNAGYVTLYLAMRGNSSNDDAQLVPKHIGGQTTS